MLKKTLVSPLALAFGLALSGAAAAQIMVGGNEVSEEQLPHVQAYCDELAAREAGDDQSASTDGDYDPDAPVEDEAITGEDGALVGFNLSTLTAQDCRDAGLID